MFTVDGASAVWLTRFLERFTACLYGGRFSEHRFQRWEGRNDGPNILCLFDLVDSSAGPLLGHGRFYHHRGIELRSFGGGVLVAFIAQSSTTVFLVLTQTVCDRAVIDDDGPFSTLAEVLIDRRIEGHFPCVNQRKDLLLAFN